jgi:hypothetical protein
MTPKSRELSAPLKARVCMRGTSLPTRIYLGIHNPPDFVRSILGFQVERQYGAITRIATTMQPNRPLHWSCNGRLLPFRFNWLN